MPIRHGGRLANRALHLPPRPLLARTMAPRSSWPTMWTSSCRYRCRRWRRQFGRSGTWRAPCRGRPLPALIAGGAGTRPDHPISGHRRSALPHRPNAFRLLHSRGPRAVMREIYAKARFHYDALRSACSWPTAARAQQPAMPVIGFLESRTPEALSEVCADFAMAQRSRLRRGRERNDRLSLAENQADRLPAWPLIWFAARSTSSSQVGPGPAFAAKSATTTIPIVFTAAEDPVKRGIVTSLARPVAI